MSIKGALYQLQIGAGTVLGVTAGYVEGKRYVQSRHNPEEHPYVVPSHVIYGAIVGTCAGALVIPFWLYLPAVLHEVKRYKNE